MRAEGTALYTQFPTPFPRTRVAVGDLVTLGARVFQRKIICNEGIVRSEAFLRGIPDATYFTCRFAANFTLYTTVPVN